MVISRKLLPTIAVALALALLGSLMQAPVALAAMTGSTAVTARIVDGGLPVSDGNPLRMWYTSPVSDWENQALVQGNGTTGLMAFGSPGRDRLHFNEKTLWTGGPADGRTYLGGNKASALTPEQLNTYRLALDDKSTEVFGLAPSTANSQLTDLMFGKTGGMGMYQDFGDAYLDFSAAGITDDSVSNYVRDLDLSTAVSSVNFDHDGVHYEREYFVSYPDQVAVVRLSASEPGRLSFTTSTTAASGLTTVATADPDDKRITLAGQVNDNQMRAEMQLRLKNDGGTVSSSDGRTLTVDGADTVTLVYSTGTNYENEYPTYRGEDPHDAITQRVDSAVSSGFDALLDRHLDDYEELFSRVKFDVGGSAPNVPTDELMRNARAGSHDLAVDQLAYQFGRYLSIAGSRAGDLPTNLCGLWLVGSAGAFWGADYHFNVNVQMNYWPAMITNLAETQVPFNDYVESLVVPGRLTAERSAAVTTEDFANAPLGTGNGFLINTQVNPFGHTAPIGSQEYGWNIGGSSWAMQNLYDYYLFTGDEEYLRDSAYPMLKEMAAFWNEYLWYSPYQQRLTVAPSVSAEQGPTAVGTAYDQSLVWELYRMAIEASEKLGVDEDLRAVWQDKQSQLDPILIGAQGQVKEWFEETTLGKAQAGDLPETDIWNFGAGGSANQGSVHRHTSQLIGLFPGTLISKDTPEWLEAAVTSLEQRSLNGTGWSKAMKINMYARTGLAEDTYSMVRAMFAGNRNGLLDNLLDSHPPFQIDGNFGLTAGMTEMLVQSQLGYTQFLPALPTAWKDGSVEGLVARGNFVVDMDWADGIATEFRVTARNGGQFTGSHPGIAEATVKDADGGIVPVTVDGSDRISFATVAGRSYTIAFENHMVRSSLDLNEAVAPGSTVDAELRIRNLGAETVADVEVEVAAPAGWAVSPSTTVVDAIAGNDDIGIPIEVTVPPTAADGAHLLSVTTRTATGELTINHVVDVARTNVALDKSASQSSTWPLDGGFTYGAEKAVDGNTIGNGSNLANTAGNESSPWWQVDLGGQFALTETAVWNRVDCCTSRLKGYTIAVSSEPFPNRPLTSEDLGAEGVWSTVVASQAGRPTPTPTATTGRYVRIQLDNATAALNLSEVEVFGTPTPTPSLALSASAAPRCVGSKALVTVRVTNDDIAPVDIRVQTPYGEKSFAGVAAGKNAFHVFTVRAGSIPAGAAIVEATGTGELEGVSFSESVDYAAESCG
ncbi:glycosyl hydrolase family 95 catalytic domain-containing protein [Agromyces laixinhei]|uniref:glycosyl hydrolase family 95 catalytic domain-containing protein n=1 Tax=Agromyces laixinhei TaxID=2585717 RepID=UPI0012ECD139|nr:glycoside hydrolase N-terminal domain-containing protein [Agromyces laixinhei]